MIDDILFSFKFINYFLFEKAFIYLVIINDTEPHSINAELERISFSNISEEDQIFFSCDFDTNDCNGSYKVFGEDCTISIRESLLVFFPQYYRFSDVSSISNSYIINLKFQLF